MTEAQPKMKSKKKAWVWFKGGYKENGKWISGFLATSDDEEGVLIEHPNFVTCRVPIWRVSFIEPPDETLEPQIPKNPSWKNI